MAIAKMSHVRLIGLRRDQNKIIDELSEGGLFEARAVDSVPSELISGDTGLYRELKLKQSKVAFALGFLKARHEAMASALEDNARKVKKGEEQPIEYTLSGEKYGGGRTLITHDDFSDAAAREYELLHVCDELQRISFDIVDCQSRMGNIKSTVTAYAPFAAAPIKLSEQSRSGGISISLYYSRNSSAPQDVLDALPCAYEIRRNDGALVIVVCKSENADEISQQMGASGFTRCPFDDDCTAEQKITALENELNDVKRQIFELTKNALDYEKYVADLRILYDVIELDIERAKAEESFAKTDSTFVLEGWLPEAVAQETVDKVTASCKNICVQLLAPKERDEPPTLVLNSKVVKPYEQITDMYSSPRYREIDPNPIMAIFYFLFFGIMIGDAGYGLVLAIAGFLVGTSKKFDVGIKRLALLVGMGGISAIVWGVLFGGYFSIDFGETKVAILLNPLDKPLLLLVLSIGFGVVQIVTGFIIKFVALCKEGKPFSAVFDCGSIILLFAALICLVIGMLPSLAPMLGVNVGFVPPKSLNIAAIALALTGVALILFFGGRNSKNVFGKVIGGFKGLYGLVNLLSDLLSYCRLFGLCLASCAIGLAFNRLGEILMGVPIAGYVIGGIVLAVLHVFNLALGVLSAYVHDARLQFLEFYGKFYDGGGRLFAPLGSKTKYVRFN
ncbi:MAG: V-type ATP synthase subunit I [Clostridiales bacterium]|nr:V-type ATP synthase subunit I [Clostridiales bacterium]